MSYTFYVKDWEKQPKTTNKKYVRDIYDETEEEVEASTRHYYPEAQKDAEGWFIMEESFDNPFPELHVSHGHLTPILNSINIKFDYCGNIPKEHINDVLKTILKALNIASLADSNEIETVREGNFTSFGIDGDRIREKLSELAEVLKFAKQHDKDVYWG